MLGRLLTNIYTLIVSFFLKWKTVELEGIQETDSVEEKPNDYILLLESLQSTLSGLPETVINAGDFDNINYRMVVTRFQNVGGLLNNLECIISKYTELYEHPSKANTDFPDFISMSYSQDQATVLANFLMFDGKYLNIKEVVELVKKYTGEVITLYTQLTEQKELDEDFILYFERLTSPSIREIIKFIERLHILGVKNV